ncbi:MAG: radical SAM family heme chaperone HemW [Hyphomicrobiales bacterium]
MPRNGPGFAVYVHWPFCLAKCPYCDFNSHVRQGGIDEARFLNAYLAELDHMAALTGPREVASVFFGGGTPSLMPPATVEAILGRIAANWSLGGGAEITLEANPTSVEASRFAALRAGGVNRVSLGVQALDDASLKALGRMHTAREALAALQVAKANYGRVSFDMIYARPGQTARDWRRELKEALGYAAGHLSLYQLTIEDGTPFAALHRAGRLVTPPDEEAGALYELTQELCGAAGLPAYEISNHAAAGEESRHNLVYWRSGEWAGVGPGAHGRVHTGGTRAATATLKSPEAWLAAVERQGHGMETFESVSVDDAREEYLLMALRLTEGADIARYESMGGRLDPARLAQLEADGLLEIRGGRLAATPSGRLVLNRLIAELIR